VHPSIFGHELGRFSTFQSILGLDQDHSTRT
jgi:hypothetical protein